MLGARVHVTGIVQGVGFRPFVWTLAHRLELSGWVRNSSSGVDISLEGNARAVEKFLELLGKEAPPLARIEHVEHQSTEPEGHSGFRILPSQEEGGGFLPVPADVATCPACLRELRDPDDRRYRYPFVNCTHCGPRFTLIRDMPYDRPATTMAGFPLCPACAAEYEDPADRRFHAQPIACPTCGPRVWLEIAGRRIADEDAAIREARARLATGAVLAVKSLGGYHLAVSAFDPAAVQRLRGRKGREEKPFALMAASPAEIEAHAILTTGDRLLLESPERPIVLLPRRPGSTLPEVLAPGRDRLGFMLPYTPLHHLLLEEEPGFPKVLVMTSGNRSDEPIAYQDEAARTRLAALADGFLLHDRPIHIRCDDSVAAAHRGRVYFFRRSRGYAPRPLPLPFPGPRILAVGGELKNTFCLTRDGLAFQSHYIGDLEYVETTASFEEGIEHYRRLFRIEPEVVVHDLHPDYRSTRWALAFAALRGLPVLGVQHHHAHVAACMADHGLGRSERVIGVAFDGTGYGTDGAIWGGEFLLAGYENFERALHLAYSPLPGGDAEIRAPYRIALCWMREAGIPWDEELPPVRFSSPLERAILDRRLRSGLNMIPTSSVGRLFDVAAALAGLSPRTTYEAQAACEFEAIADRSETASYPFHLGDVTLYPDPALRALAEDVGRGTQLGVISARFHRGLSEAVVAACCRLREETGLGTVALSGGVWQNLLLLELTEDALGLAGFRTLVHHQVPANDGGISLGQAVVAAARLDCGQDLLRAAATAAGAA